MLKFLKSIFSPREILKEDVSLQSLLIWYNQKAAEHFSGSKDVLYENYNSIKTEIQEIANEAKQLAFADIEDSDKIEIRVKQIVLGQRSSFVRQITAFAENFLDEIPKDFTMDSAIIFCEQADFLLDELSRSTIKSFHASQHLFHEHVNKIGKNITSVSSAVKSVKQELRNKKADDVKKLRVMVTDLLQKNSSKELLLKTLDDKRREKAEKVKNRNSIMDRIIELQKSKLYNKYIVVNDEAEFAKKELHEAEDSIVILFQPLMKALKKLERITSVDQNIIAKYAETPIDAIKEDKDFKILRILENLERNINAGSVELKDKEKAIARIKEITRSLLTEKSGLLQNREKKYSEIKKKLAGFSVVVEKVRLENELEESRRGVNQAEEEIEALERRASINYYDLQRQVTDGIRDMLYYEVNLC